jgi:hypothetical protein
MRDILYHTLRNPHSASWFAIMLPNLDETLNFHPLHKGSLQMVSIILAWVSSSIPSPNIDHKILS